MQNENIVQATREKKQNVNTLSRNLNIGELTPARSERERQEAPWNTQSRISLTEELGFHPTTYFPASNPGGKLASPGNSTRRSQINYLICDPGYRKDKFFKMKKIKSVCTRSREFTIAWQ